MKFLTTLFLALSIPIIAVPIIAHSQSYPAAFVVTGVASDDTLNIRAEPNANSQILGTIGPYGINIEVLKLSPNGKWGMVSTREGNGWTSMRYLELSNHTGPNELPRPMTCFGTEPFWALSMLPRGDQYQLAGEHPHNLAPISQTFAYQGYAVVFEEGPTLNRTLMVERGYCDDGMSDREYGWRAILLNETPEGNSLNFGCCTLDHQ